MLTRESLTTNNP